jgi:hypothetical protein
MQLFMVAVIILLYIQTVQEAEAIQMHPPRMYRHLVSWVT